MTHYMHASGIIKSLEGRLLSRAKIHQLAESGNLEEFTRNLSDTIYGSMGSQLFEPKNFNSFSHELAKLARTLIDEGVLRNFFLLENDILNLRAVIKSLKQDIEPPEVGPAPEGKVSYKSMIARIKEKKYFLLPEVLFACSDAVLGSKKELSPMDVDMKIDELFFAWALGNAANNEIFWRYIKRRIDIINILNLLRARYFFAAVDNKQKASWFLPGGNIDKSEYISALQESVKLMDFFKRIVFFDYFSQFENMEFGEDKLAEFSKFADDSITLYWQKARLDPFGFHVVTGYLHAKNIEIKNLRIIQSAIASGPPPAELKKRIRENYV